MLRRFENKIALVTGGAGGIGLGITRRFSAEGAAVVIADINGAAGLTAQQEIRAAGARAHFVEMDLGCTADVARTVEQALEVFGRIDILVNCAAVVGKVEPIVEISAENWERVIRTNLTGTFLLTQSSRAAHARARRRRLDREHPGDSTAHATTGPWSLHRQQRRPLRYDNLKSAVKKILRGYRREETAKFIAFRSHWGFQSQFCTPGEGHEKGGIEGEVCYFGATIGCPCRKPRNWKR